jgi:hypothetical protein
MAWLNQLAANGRQPPWIIEMIHGASKPPVNRLRTLINEDGGMSWRRTNGISLRLRLDH